MQARNVLFLFWPRHGYGPLTILRQTGGMKHATALLAPLSEVLAFGLIIALFALAG